ncbi:hypothetical protein F5J12DRAFT_716586 [Pisolithus orientalis]|uniref:uncharacterized protein n=1 Tax=Pisolithus orientalis TaxID=936130 RepID=UPI0022244C02|nr:uncharacterized protein F5J12DRAFT_716586 [Pisolithus orientalis]KAI6019898.1 hypothetical protein F5J12DRAFT_716586 [Pisolithus orientalis]
MAADQVADEIARDDATSDTTDALERDEDASEAQAQIIASLRSQVTDLFTQVTQLNSKLVASYDRVSDLEDQLHEASSSLRNSSITISSLELERAEHLAALNTGLLVEKAHVTAELNRLMERATEEAAQRGQAESARHDIEKDLDDLSATLFDQANTMVAEARLNQARSERKVREAEEALRSAEEAVKVMQSQMQALEADKTAAEREATGARITMGKGKWVERSDSEGDAPKLRFLTIHTPYAEFAALVAYLRTLRTSQLTPPTISSLLNQPFLARLNTEDLEPTVRLDLAPSLNWLSRPSVLAAIHTGMLIIEPMPFLNLVQELSSQSRTITTVSCSLCGTRIARLTPGSAREKPPGHPLASLTRSSSASSNSWFKYPLVLSSPTPGSEVTFSHLQENAHPELVYVFRVVTQTSSQPPPPLASVHSKQGSSSPVSTSSRLPVHSSTTSRALPAQSNNSPHPLCTSNYCLLRLRTTCSLWAFVRSGIIERIWQEEVTQLPSSASADRITINGNGSLNPPSTPRSSQPTLPSASEKPPVPPRRRRLWDMAVSWGKEGGESLKLKDKEKENSAPKRLPSPPPSHPSVPHPHGQPSRLTSQVPPALPKRSETRSTTPEGATADTSAGCSANSTVPNTEPVAVDSTAVGLEQKDKHTSSESFATPTDEVETPLPAPVVGVNDEVPANVQEEQTSTIIPSECPISSQTVSQPQTPPASVSPPRSRVGSPIPQSVASPMSLSRSRAGSPASGRPSSPFPPSRTGSPVPPQGAPPVPRRAPARRAAPLPPSTPMPERPSALPTRLKREGTKKSKESEGSKVVEAPKTSVAVTTSNREDGGDSEPSSTSIDGRPENVDTPAGPPTGDKRAGLSTDTTSPSERQTPAPSEPVDVPPEVPTTTSEATAAKHNKHCPSINTEGFAGDGTWEERTWKEVIRLREEMFWARVGCVREL